MSSTAQPSLTLKQSKSWRTSTDLAGPSSDGTPSDRPNNGSAPRRNASEEQGDAPATNNIEALRKGIIKTSKNKGNAPYTILLIGETGVGKSSLSELIANVLNGKDIDNYDFKILAYNDEQGGSDKRSQTKEARLYELTSNNGIVVRVLDTPGVAETRCFRQDESHKRRIATQIKKHANSVTAVLVLANGTVPRTTSGTDTVLSILSSIFPGTLKTPANNVALVLTNVSSPLFQNFSGDTVPVIKDAPQFLLNNPVALQKKYLALKDDPVVKEGGTDWRGAIEAEEQNTLEVLVELFDWLDGLEQQPTTGADPLWGIMAALKEQLTPKKANDSAMFALLAGGTRIVSAMAVGCELEARAQPQSWTDMIGSHREFLRKAEEKVQEGVWKVKQIFVGE